MHDHDDDIWGEIFITCLGFRLSEDNNNSNRGKLRTRMPFVYRIRDTQTS